MMHVTFHSCPSPAAEVGNNNRHAVKDECDTVSKILLEWKSRFSAEQAEFGVHQTLRQPKALGTSSIYQPRWFLMVLDLQQP